MLAPTGFIAGGSHATIADLFAYEELGQNQARYANCTDFSGHPHIEAWLAETGSTLTAAARSL